MKRTKRMDRWCGRVLALGAVCLVASARVVPADDAPPLVPAEYLTLSGVNRGGRSALHTDPVEALIVSGEWKSPKESSEIKLPDGSSRKWQKAAADASGKLIGVGFRAGYAFTSIDVSADRVVLLEASGHSIAYVNGEPRPGDPYGYGTVKAPVHLKRGVNELLFLSGRGAFSARLTAPPSPVFLSPQDQTLPDLRRGEEVDTWAALLVTNATDAWTSGLELESRWEGGSTIRTAVPPLAPLSVRKVGYRIRGRKPSTTGERTVTVRLMGRGVTAAPLPVKLRVREPHQTYRRTFISDIDGSVQYYAVNPASLPQKNPALFLSLHGASVEAIGQADAYSPKSWGHLVAPTNRRPFGFDWEDWGRIDAMEVLAHAQKELNPDPARIYLTGHSMGGHGTWQLGAHFPDRFAAIGPSAGWVSFWSYAGGPRPQNPSPAESMLLRASSQSDTLALQGNFRQLGVYVLHGDADDNVPVDQARSMKSALMPGHPSFDYFEQKGAGHWWDASDEPGADCVDWAPLFDFFGRHARPGVERVREIKFTTVHPAISAWSYWAGVEGQQHWSEPSTLALRLDPGARRISGATQNVSRLALDAGRVLPAGKLVLSLDGGKIELSELPAGGRVHLTRGSAGWNLAGPLPAAMKRPERCGPFKEAFRNRMVLVYGTGGDESVRKWAFARARLDAEAFWYRGNGSVDIVPDTQFDAAREPDRNVILYGNRETNRAWDAVLERSAVDVTATGIRVGRKMLSGGDLAAAFVQPRRGSDRALVGVVGGSGLAGMRLTDRLPYFVSGAGFPDCLVLDPKSLLTGSAGVRAAGFFGSDWRAESGDFVWNR